MVQGSAVDRRTVGCVPVQCHESASGVAVLLPVFIGFALPSLIAFVFTLFPVGDVLTVFGTVTGELGDFELSGWFPGGFFTGHRSNERSFGGKRVTLA